MKRLLQLIFLLCATIGCAYAQCYEGHREAGIAAYNKGDYAEAKKHFEYILSSCEDKPARNDIQSWIDKCNTALEPTVMPRTSNSNTRNKNTPSGSVNGGQNANIHLHVTPTSISSPASGKAEYIKVDCNTNWEIQYDRGTMYRATRSGNMVKVLIFANTSTSGRTGEFIIKTADGSIVQKISLSQQGNTSNVNNSSNARNSNSAPYLTLSQTSINAGAAGTTQTIGVASNQSWKIDYPTGNMYSVTRNGNNIIVKINPNNTSVIRNDFFQVSTLDGSTNVKVYLYQAAAAYQSSRKSYSVSRSNSSYGQNTVYQSPYRRYIHENGVFEITWFGIRAGVGTAGALSYSLFKMRWGPIQFSPLEGTATYNFLSSHSNMDMDVSYQPTIDAFIPLGNNNALYAGIGPSYNFVSSDIWFKAEAGWHLHYGYCTSSDFFFRYDGTFCVGVSIQWSTGW